MITMRLSEAAQSMGGVLRGADSEFRGVGTDSRKSLDGALFFAIKGENHDGHDHALRARDTGAAAVVVARDDAAFGEPRIVVNDTLAAMGQLAGTWRARSKAAVIAITGNSGKTTTKEFTAAVLREAGETLATEGNLNNEIGVPMTLFGLNETHKFAVIELGQGKPGDIAYLVNFTKPDIALVTNITGAHLAHFDSMEAIAAGKGEIYAQLEGNGIAIINADDEFAAFWRSRLPAAVTASMRVITFGLADDADIRAEDVMIEHDGCVEFTLVANDVHTTVSLAIPGMHNVSNALAAAAVGVACGVHPIAIARALAPVMPVGSRLAMHHLANGVRVIDDTYNANPGSVKAAIRTLCAGGGRRRVLVLGHMAELGAGAAALHREIGEFARDAGVDVLYVTGDFANETAAGFGDDAQVFADIGELSAAVFAEANGEWGAGMTILVKGSRSARMERVVAVLTGENDAALAH